MIKSVQALRFVFIMLVVFSHFYGKVFDFGGECGVSFFFMLSGFIISYAYATKVEKGTFQHKRFLVRQLLKFYPLHVLTFIIMVVLDARLGHFFSWDKLLANLLLLQSWVPSDEFYFVANGLSWFLSDLVFFYLMFPVVLRLLMHVSRQMLAVTTVVVVVLYAILAASIPHELVNPLLYASPLTRLIDFAIGILLYRFYRSGLGECLRAKVSGMQVPTVTLVELVMVVAVVFSFFIYEQSSLRFRCAALFWLVLPMVLFAFVVTDSQKGVVTTFFHHPLMQWLGSISLEVYLTHWVVIRLFLSLLTNCGYGDDGGLLRPVNLVLTLCVIIAVAWLTKRYFVDVVFARLKKYVL